jgi:copper(I)-binding protein
MRLALVGLVVLLATNPALAHKGVLHEGCPTGQSFNSGLVTVSGAFLRATPPNAKSAGAYLSLFNHGNETDTLLAVHSEAAANVAIHAMSMEGDVMKMAPLEGGLSVLPGETVTLEPMGYHLMLTGMEQPFVEGQCVEMVLEFDKAGPVTVQFNIGSLTQGEAPTGEMTAPMAEHDMDDMSSMEGM